MTQPDAATTEYLVLRPEPGLPDIDMPALYANKLLARAEMVADGQEYLRFHEGQVVWAYPTDDVEVVDGGSAQVWVVSRTLPHDWNPSFPRDEP